MLRHYQIEALEAIKRKFKEGINKQVVVMPTGTGKSIVIASAKSFLGLTKKTLFLVHRDELIQQAKKQFLKWQSNETIEIEQAENYASEKATVILASVPTLGRKNSERIKRFNPEKFDLILGDECHHFAANSYLRIVEYFSTNPNILLVGFTATPNRTDAIGLNNIFQEIVYNYPIYDGKNPSAIRDGYLVDIKGVRVETDVGLDHIPTVAGDLAQNELEKTINISKRNELVVKSWTTYGENRPTIAFCSGVAHAKTLAQIFTNYNIKAEAIWGEDPQRTQKLKDFKTGNVTILTNCQLLGEGIDLPKTSSIILARPTKSSLVYAQAIGRGLRLPEGVNHISEAKEKGLKTDCIVIDVVDNTKRHSIITIPSLLGLPINLSLNGKSLFEAADKLKEIINKNPNIDYSQLKNLNEVEVYAEEIDFFDTSLSSEVAENTQLNWVKVGQNKYSLRFYSKKGVGVATIELNKSNLWQITAECGAVLNDTANSLQSAFFYADSWLKVYLDYYSYQLIKNNSKIVKTLKKQKISEKQLNLLLKFKPHLRNKLQTLSKFEASKLIDKVLSK